MYLLPGWKPVGLQGNLDKNNNVYWLKIPARRVDRIHVGTSRSEISISEFAIIVNYVQFEVEIQLRYWSALGFQSKENSPWHLHYLHLTRWSNIFPPIWAMLQLSIPYSPQDYVAVICCTCDCYLGSMKNETI